MAAFNLKKNISSDFGKLLIGFASSQLIGNFLKMFAGFLIVKLISPSLYGQFNGHGIFLGYLSLVHIGVFNGLNRELPVAQGKKRFDLVKELASLGMWTCNIIAFPSAAVLLVVSLFCLITSNYNEALLNFSYAFSAFFLMYNRHYMPVLYKTNQDFSKLTKISFYSSFVSILSVIFIYYSPDLKGLCFRLILINVTEFFFLYYFSPLKIKGEFSKTPLISLLRTGVPIFIVGNILPLWETIKNSIIFSIGGVTQYGYYALANVVTGAVGIIPASFSQIMYPKMAISYGNNESKKAILQMNLKPMILLAVLGVLILIVGSFTLPYLIDLFLPEYVPAVNVILWTFALPLAASPSLINNYFNIYKLQKQYFIAITFGILGSIIYLFLYNYFWSFQLQMFVQSLIIGTMIQNIFCIRFIFSDLHKV